MNTTPKQLEELDLATRFLAALGCAAIELEASDRPDVIVTLHGVRVGIEVTQFHADERLGSIGSPLRKAEVQLARKYPEAPHSMWGVPDPIPALVARISEKVEAALGYDESRYNELWLLITAGIPRLDAIGATLALPAFVEIEKLNQLTHAQLCDSVITQVYFHTILPRSLFGWNRNNKWHSVAVTQA